MINKEKAALWIAALRSGLYKSTQRRLRLNDSYCCLGVYCDIYDKSLWKKSTHSDAYLYLDIIDKLPLGIQLDLGLSDAQQSQLIYMNDQGISFDEIADQIESWLGGR